MKTKNFLVSGIAGGIVYFLLGWLFYGILFKDFFPPQEESMQAMLLIFLGCLSYSLFIAYIYTKWAQISTITTGAQAGAIIGIFTTLIFNFFNMAMNPEATYELFAMDAGISIVSSAILGAAIAAVNGKMG